MSETTHTIEIASLSPATQVALMQRGFNHIAQNEASSKVTTWVKANTKLAEDKKTILSEPTDAQIAAQKAIFVAEAVAKVRENKLANGTVPTQLTLGAGRQMADPIQEKAEALAEDDIRAKFAVSKNPNPTKKLVAERVEQLMAVRGDAYRDRARKHFEALAKRGANLKDEALDALDFS